MQFETKWDVQNIQAEKGTGRQEVYPMDTLDEFWAIGWCSGSGMHGCKPLHKQKALRYRIKHAEARVQVRNIIIIYSIILQYAHIICKISNNCYMQGHKNPKTKQHQLTRKYINAVKEGCDFLYVIINMFCNSTTSFCGTSLSVVMEFYSHLMPIKCRDQPFSLITFNQWRAINLVHIRGPAQMCENNHTVFGCKMIWHRAKSDQKS